MAYYYSCPFVLINYKKDCVVAQWANANMNMNYLLSDLIYCTVELLAMAAFKGHLFQNSVAFVWYTPSKENVLLVKYQ